MSNFEPNIVAYLCTWCSYTGADTAGISRLKSPANVKAIRVPCSGRISAELIIKTFDQGADGVLVLGCHIGECHYESGNHRTAKRIPILKSLLAFAGLEPERLELDWVSASEGEKFSRVVTEFTEFIKSMGPTTWRIKRRELVDIEEIKYPIRTININNNLNISTNLPSSHSLLDEYERSTIEIRNLATKLLLNNEVQYIIGYEKGSKGLIRPVIIDDNKDIDRLVWDQYCSQNLTRILLNLLEKKDDSNKKTAIIVKPCDSRSINVMLAENRFNRDQVYIIGTTCDGKINQKVIENEYINKPAGDRNDYELRCQICVDHKPVIYDTLIGDLSKNTLEKTTEDHQLLNKVNSLTKQERFDFWMSQFDKCIRCYACRQVCPICDCPTCLYERDDSLWVGPGIDITEKRAFHLGRAFHLAGRCTGCEECDRACPMEIPISLLTKQISNEIWATHKFRAGDAIVPSPIITRFDKEEIQL